MSRQRTRRRRIRRCRDRSPCHAFSPLRPPRNPGHDNREGLGAWGLGPGAWGLGPGAWGLGLGAVRTMVPLMSCQASSLLGAVKPQASDGKSEIRNSKFPCDENSEFRIPNSKNGRQGHSAYRCLCQSFSASLSSMSRHSSSSGQRMMIRSCHSPDWSRTCSGMRNSS